MSEAVASTGTVHWVGTGLSTGSGLRVLADNGGRVVVWGRTADRAETCLARLGLSGRAEARAYDPRAFADELQEGDVVVSMLPATEHSTLLRMCITHRAHFACTSYVTALIEAEVLAAGEAGLVVLAEAGLDPGIDHLLADLLVARARAHIDDDAATAEFTSYCGGIPAQPNEFRYRFSWAPRGVLTALCAPARHIEEGVAKVVEHPWEVIRPHVIDDETFEVYPNRDSIPYLVQYDVPSSWRVKTFVRGTLRLDGWQEAWADVFAELRTADRQSIAALADELAIRYPTTDADRDRVVLVVALRVRGDSGRTWAGEYLLDAVGEASESAMARCVSLPLSFGVTEILAGRVQAGLHRAAQGAENAERWLAFLSRSGLPCRFSELVGDPAEVRGSRHADHAPIYEEKKT
jgi:hypothetical protein